MTSMVVAYRQSADIAVFVCLLVFISCMVVSYRLGMYMYE